MAYGFQIKDAANNLTLDTSVNPPNNLLDVREIGSTEVTSFNVTDYDDSNSWYVTLPMPLSGQEYVEMMNYADIPTQEFYGLPIANHTTGTNSFSFDGSNLGTSSDKKLQGLFIAGKYRGTFSDDFASGYGATFRNQDNNTVITANHAPFFSIARGFTSVNSNSSLDSARNTELSGTRCYTHDYNSTHSNSINPCQNRIQQIVSGDKFFDGRRCAYYSCNSRHDFIYDSSSHVLPDGKAVYPLVFLRIPDNVYISNLVFHRPSNTSQTCVSFWAMTTSSFYTVGNSYIRRLDGADVARRGRWSYPMTQDGFEDFSLNLPSNCNNPNIQTNYTSPIEIMLCYAGNAPQSTSADGIEFFDTSGNPIFNTDMTCPTVEGFQSQNYNTFVNRAFFTTGGFGNYYNYADNGFGFNLGMQNSNNFICINSLGTGSRGAASGYGYEWQLLRDDGNNFALIDVRADVFATDYIYRSGSTAYYGTGLIIGGGFRSRGGQNYEGVYQKGRKFLMEVSTPT